MATTAPTARVAVPNLGDDTVSVIDTASNTVTDTLTGFSAPRSVAIDNVGAPVVTGISPAAGPLAGGNPVTITGTDLSGASAITFGAGNDATDVSCTDTSATSTADRYTYH